MTAAGFLALILALGAVEMDLRSRRIANVWLAAGWAAGFWIQLSPGGRGAAAFAAGSLLPLALLAVLFPDAGRRRYQTSVCAGRPDGGFGGTSVHLLVISVWSGVLHRNFICLRQLVAASFIFFPLYQRVFNNENQGSLPEGE